MMKSESIIIDESRWDEFEAKVFAVIDLNKTMKHFKKRIDFMEKVLSKVQTDSIPDDESVKESPKKLTFGKGSVVLGQLSVGIVLFGLWELCSGRFFNSFWMSKPSLILARIYKLLLDGTLWFHLSTTLEEILLGLVLGMLGGVFLGIFLAYSGPFQDWLSPYILALSSLPKASMAPLFVIWLGIGLMSKVSMVLFMVIFAVFFNVYDNIRNIDPSLTDMMKAFRATPLQKLRWVILPSITACVLNTLRISIGNATIGAVISEMVGANSGVGYYITYSSGVLDTTGTFAGLFIIMFVAIVLGKLVGLLEKRLLRYR